MKYKVGDKVRIRKDLEADKRYSGIRFDERMMSYRGKIATISLADDEVDIYRIDLNETFAWGEDMFMGFVRPKKAIGENSQEKVIERLDRVLKDVPKEEPYNPLSDKTTPLESTAKNDAVSHPSHYTDGKIEVIDYIEDKKLGYHLGNACKYISRCQLKYGGKKRIEDLRKAIWYIQRQIEVWEKDDKQKTKQGY